MSKFLLTAHRVIDSYESIEDVKKHNDFLKLTPKIEDFINFDMEGFELNDNVPLFKGWEVCQDSSREVEKVAKLEKDGMTYIISFHKPNDPAIFNDFNLSDNLTYQDLAYFFDNKLELNKDLAI